MAMQWTEHVLIGIDEIDIGIKEFFRRMNNLLVAMSRGRGRWETREMIGFLEDFASAHFSIEERYMAECGYPDCESHREEHEGFIKDLAYLRGEYEAGEVTTFFVLKVERWVYDWIIHHVGKTDKALYDFLRGGMRNREMRPDCTL